MNYLEEVVFSFHRDCIEFSNRFFSLFKNVTEIEDGKIYLKKSNDRYVPEVAINTSSMEKEVVVDFYLNTGENLKIEVKNETGILKKSNEVYSYIDLNEIIDRFNQSGIRITKIDHIGFNLPWFSDPVHPKIRGLRNFLRENSLYHTFPTGEPWDFILPASKDEINGSVKTDYSLIRKPKIEIVSFDKCSTPIVQFDVGCSYKKELFTKTFPESLFDKNIGNIWIYVNNPFGLDLCLVLNEDSGGDWGSYFKNNRS
jgi:hypothetical protein